MFLNMCKFKCLLMLMQVMKNLMLLALKPATPIHYPNRCNHNNIPAAPANMIDQGNQ